MDDTLTVLCRGKPLNEMAISLSCNIKQSNLINFNFIERKGDPHSWLGGISIQRDMYHKYSVEQFQEGSITFYANFYWLLNLLLCSITMLL